MREQLTTSVTRAWLMLALVSCAARPSAAPAKEPGARPRAAETWQSPTFAYQWTLGPDWEFYSPSEIGVPQTKLVVDVVAARRKGMRSPSALLYVWDYTLGDAKRTWGTEPADYDDLETFGREVLDAHDIEFLAARRVELFGERGVEVVGAHGNEGLWLRMMRRDRRHFEVRCLGPLHQPEWPCESAFKAFTIADPPELAAPEGPRILHLREPRFGLEFDAPDDSWLATGPRLGAGGAQLLWIWSTKDRQIDVQVIDFRGLSTEPSEEQILGKHASYFRRAGAKVVVGRAQLGGEPCHHLRVKRRDGWGQDMFLLHRNSINYTVMITQRHRDAKLIARITKALRFTLLDHERERREARLAAITVARGAGAGERFH